MVYNVAFAHSGLLLASGTKLLHLVASEDGTVRIWDLNGEVLKLLEGHQESVNAVCFSPDDLILASGEF